MKTSVPLREEGAGGRISEFSKQKEKHIQKASGKDPGSLGNRVWAPDL